MESRIETFDYIFVRRGDYFVKIRFTDITWIEANGSYSDIHMKNKTKITLSFNLSEISSKIMNPMLVRIHRSFIVNLEHVDAFIGNMVCIGNDHLPVSKQYRENIFHSFNILK